MRRAAAPALALAGTALLLCGLAASASAGTYKAAICSPTANEPLFIFEGTPPGNSQGFHFKRECGQPFGGVRLIADSATVLGAVRMGVDAAPKTTLEEIEFDRTFTSAVGGWNQVFNWSLGTFITDSSVESVTTTAPANGHVSHALSNAPTALFGQLLCLRSGAGCGIANGTVAEEVDLANVVVTLEDKHAPTIATTPPAAGTTLSGTVQIPYEATDEGGGVEVSRLLLDGTPAAAAEDHDENGGRCHEPFNFIQPCKLLVQRSFSLNTAQLANGTHTLTPVAIDAAGNATAGQPFPITVHNGPTDKTRPALSGTAKVGEKLTSTQGEWEGTPTAFAFQWLRCLSSAADGSEAGCEPIGGATTAEYVAKSADVGRRLVAKVTATNGAGADTALSPPSAIVAEASTGHEGPGGGGQEGPAGAGPPQTKIAKHPRSKTSMRMARFTFSADQSGSSFQCKLDKGPFRSCRSPFKHRVKRGRHTFRVQARNAAGASDPTPAVFRWRVL